MNNRPIFITGVPRSGTSMTAGLFSINSFYGGELIGATKDNKNGFFENRKIREGIVKRRLAAAGIDVLAQTIWKYPEEIMQDKYVTLNSKSPLLLKKEVEEIMTNEGVWDNADWFYKCAKLPLFGLIWSRAWPEATVVIVKREREGHINSLLRTGFMKCCSTPDAWNDWIDVYDDYLNRLKDLFADVREVYFEDITNGNFEGIEDILSERNMEFNEQLSSEFLYVPTN